MGSLEKQLTEKKISSTDYKKDYAILILTTIFAFLLLIAVSLFEPYSYKVFPSHLYLTWHNIFEFISCLVSFCIFAITYYTYPWTGNKRSLFLGCVFLLVGFIDGVHALSYKGMPVFFTVSSAPKATMFWIIARLFFAFGALISLFVPRKDLGRKVARWKFLVLSIGLSVFVFGVVTYYPEFLPPMYIDGVGLTKIKVNLEYFIVCLQCLSVFLLLQQYRTLRERIFILFASALVLSITSELVFTLYKSVYDTYNLLGHLYKMISYYLFFRILFLYNVYRPYKELEKAQLEIGKYVDNLEKIVEKRTGEIMEINKILINDLDYAKKIQQAMLPAPYLKFEGVEFGAAYLSCQRVGGDFYNIFPLTDEVLGMYLGDVAGHGVPAAMMTVFIYQSMEGRNFNKDVRSDILPNQVLQELYRIYNNTDFPADMYIVMLLATFNPQTGTLFYSSAGINTLPIVFSPNRERIFLEHQGFPLCKLGELYQPVYVNHQINLKPGDKVIFYTDGLTEAVDNNGNIFSEKRLCELLEREAYASAKELTETICREIEDFIGKDQLSDDITFFILHYTDNKSFNLEKFSNNN